MSACSPSNTSRSPGGSWEISPQAFSHVAMVNSPMNLCDGAKPAEQRSEKKAA
jgi:hypothetical protein